MVITSVVTGVLALFLKLSPSPLGLSCMSLKEEQLSAIKTRRNVFVCLPTGYGKSLYYQTLLFVMEHELGGDRSVIIVSLH